MQSDAAKKDRLENPFRDRGVRQATSGVDAREASASERRQVRELTGYEEEFIEAHRDHENLARLCNEILARCLVAPGEDHAEASSWVRGRLVAERDAMLLELRRKSLGDLVESQVRCPTCGTDNEVNFSLDTIDADFDVPDEPLEVDLDGKLARVRMPTALDQEQLLESGSSSEAERRTWLLSRLVISLGERSESVDVHTVRALSMRHRKRLEDAVEEALPDFELAMGVQCVDCDAEFTAPFDLVSFFLGS